MDSNIETQIKEYDLLGFRLKVTEQMIQDSEINPSDVIELVQSKIREINNKAPHLSEMERMIMVSLELAEINLKNQTTFQKDVNRLQNCAKDALSYISEIEPI